MSIRSICSENLITVSKHDTIQAAAELMRRHHVGSLVVTKGEPGSRLKVIGILTDRDICLEVVAQGRDAATVEVGDVMTRNPVPNLFVNW